ncbi:MAG: hypothetical protein CMP89_10005, partial [Gammaproteobacteria bacterium]|nr:hypothetical protein [Gammaproteobacteria bacterium]
MIISKVVASLFGIVFAFASAADVEIADRIKKVGEICIEGQDCGSTPIVLASVESVGVEENYNKSCATCHIA